MSKVSASELMLAILKNKNITQTTATEMLGWRFKQQFSAKLRRETFQVDELLELLEKMGTKEFTLRFKEDGFEVKIDTGGILSDRKTYGTPLARSFDREIGNPFIDGWTTEMFFSDGKFILAHYNEDKSKDYSEEVTAEYAAEYRIKNEKYSG